MCADRASGGFDRLAGGCAGGVCGKTGAGCQRESGH